MFDNKYVPAMGVAASAVVLVLSAATAVADDVPLPRARPLADEVPKVAQVYELSPLPSDCQIRLADKAELERRPTIVGPGACGGSDMVRLRAVRMTDGSRVTINPAAELRCTMATALTDFVRDAAAQSFAPARITAVENFDAYDCRGRNRVAGAKISEHGKGNAIDIRAFRLTGGKAVELTDQNVARNLRERLKEAACTQFTTVLGPGSDGYHEGHVHLDLAERRRGMRMCQWDIREKPPIMAKAEIPLPPVRPARP